MHDLDNQQWRELLARLRRFAVWLTREPGSADDLVQATVERALSRRDQQRDAQALRAWLFTILYRLYLDGKRRERLHARWLSWFGRAERDDEPVGDNLEAIILAQADLQAFSRLCRAACLAAAGQRRGPELQGGRPGLGHSYRHGNVAPFAGAQCLA